MHKKPKHTESPPSSKAAAYGYEYVGSLVRYGVSLNTVSEPGYMAYSSSTNKALYVKSPKTDYTYFGARYSDSELSVWLSVDPLASKYPMISPYMYTAGNPVNLIDRFGLDFINVHTKRKEDAKKDMDSKQKLLNKAKKRFEQFEGMTRKEAKAKNKKEYKSSKKEKKKAQRKYDRSEAYYNSEVKNEKIVNDVLEEFHSVNPEKYSEWNSFDPNGTGVIDIKVSATSLMIPRYKQSGVVIGYTTEAIHASIGIGSANFVRLRLKVQYDIKSMTSVLVHGLGHIDGGISRDEQYANEYQKYNYDDKRKP